jgi:hypothetical protein
MEMERSLESLPDEELLRRLADLLGRSRRVEADLVAHIGEVDRRRLFSRDACPSMFAYCTEVLHLSEHEAYLRITVARAAREHPVLLVLLSEGRLHLAGIAKLAPHLTGENRDALRERAVHKSKREIEALVAELAPRPDAPALMRKLPEPPVRALELGPDRAPDSAAGLGPDQVPEGRGSSGLGRAFPSLIPPAGGRDSTPRSGALPSAVHGRLCLARQAGAASRTHAVRSAGRRPGRDHREGRDREARAARSQAPWRDQGSTEGSQGDGHFTIVSAHPRGGETRGAGAGRGPVPIRGCGGPSVPGAASSRVPPSPSLRPGR